MPKSADRLRRELAEQLGPYRQLLEGLVSETMTADEFETEFLRAYKDDPRACSDEVFDIIDGFFFEVDRYVGDPELRSRSTSDAIGPDELRERARELLTRAGLGLPGG